MNIHRFLYGFLVCAALFLSGCRKESLTENGFAEVPAKFLVGTWDVVEINGTAGDYGSFTTKSKYCSEGAVNFTLSSGTMTGTFGGGLFLEDDNSQHFAMWNMLWQYDNGSGTATSYCSVDWNASDWTETSFTLTAWKAASVVDGSASPIAGGDVWKLKKREK